ncbi:hypothetical protein ACWEJ6_48695 [Nonomuraea sp. NPDC004702]
MSEARYRKIIRESRLAGAALVAAGEVFPSMLFSYRKYADAVNDIAALAEQAEGERRQQLTEELLALWCVLTEALLNRYEAAMAEHAGRLGSPAQVEARLYPPLPGDDAAEEARRAWERSIPGQADRWRRLGFAGLTQDRGHAFWRIIRLVWLLAHGRGEIETFPTRLEELVPELAGQHVEPVP